MALKTYNPVTPGQGQAVLVERSALYFLQRVNTVNAMPMANVPVGTIVHNIEIKIGKGAQIARSAGTYAQIVGRDGEYVILRLNSGEQRLVHGRCIATRGR